MPRMTFRFYAELNDHTAKQLLAIAVSEDGMREYLRVTCLVAIAQHYVLRE